MNSLKRTITTTLLLLFAAACTLHAEPLPSALPEAVGLSSDKLAKVDQVAQKFVDDKRLAGCVVGIARHGKIAYLKAFGKRDDDGNAMETDTIFRIFSMTKAITSAAIMMLVDEGKISLDDPVSKHVPELMGLKVYQKDVEFVAPKRESTIRDLLRHTGGLSYGFFGDSKVAELYREAKVLDGSLQQMVEKLGNLPLLYEPGTQWVYSVASDVLGHVVAKASGQPFADFLDQRFFKPMGMRDTAFQVPADKVSRFAASYGSDDKGNLKVIETPQKSVYLKAPTMASGGGGLVSTTRDYLRFLQMIANGGQFEGRRYVKSDLVKLMTTNQLPNEIPFIGVGDKRPGVGFGLGFSVRIGDSEFDSGARLGEYGWGGAASTHYWSSPKDDLVVVTMEQTMPYNFNLEFGLKKLIYDAVLE